MNDLAQRIARSQNESAALWAQADAATEPGARYQLAWGAMDWEANTAILLEELGAKVEA